MLLSSLLALVTAVTAQENPVAETTTASGLRYSIVTEGDGGDRPKMGDTVVVHYTGTLENGTKFDSSRDRGQPARFKLGQVIPGWNEGLQLMSKGARFNFTIPSDLGYGDRGQPPTIPGGATLLFDVELLDFIPGPKIPEFTKGNPENQQTTESGIVWEVLEAGEGTNPGPDDMCEMHFAFWTEDGTMLEATQMREQPMKGSCSQMGLKFLQEAPRLMQPGSRCRFEVPAELAFGDRAMPNLPPGSKTIWEIHLLDVVPPLPVPDFVAVDAMNLTKTDSGLQYEILREGDGDSPKMGEEVTCHYAGWLTDGTPFDSSYKRGEPASFRLGRVIAGWNEGLQLMKPGGLARFVIPADLAYGANGRPPLIPGGSTLIFLVELQK